MKRHIGNLGLKSAAIVGIALLQACAEPVAKPEALSPSENSTVSTSGTISYDGEIISIPSPIQIATLIQKNNISFNQEWINAVQNRTRYVNEVKKALNLGVYGGDLAYVANYNMGQLNNDYFDALAQLGSDIGVLENIDKQLVTKFSNSLNDKDSLLRLNADFFRAADSYLKNNNRMDVSSYILIGGWIESIHLASNAAQNNLALRTRLGEQKYAASSLLRLSSKLNDPAFLPLKPGIEDLCNTFLSLESTYSYRQPINDQREKKTYLRSQTSVKISDEQLAQISLKIKNLRNSIIE